MKKLLILNTAANIGSTGRIADNIGQRAMDSGYDCWFAYGRASQDSSSHLLRIGGEWDCIYHGLKSRIFDNHCFSSSYATKKFIREVEMIRPDIINIHNLHGYYINIEILFNYLKTTNIPVVWTLHDCWPFTGHCTYFERFNCMKWQTLCNDCPNKRGYPASYFIDNAKNNFLRKEELFTQLKNLSFVVPSKWMSDLLAKSFLKDYPKFLINNGIDLDKFRPINSDDLKDRYDIKENKILLGVASTWDKRKGLSDFLKLSNIAKDDFKIILVGINKRQIKSLPPNILGIQRTENQNQLASLYSLASVFINPTYVDNFPTTNLEALACGTSVITYNTGGSPETIDDNTGIVVNKGDISGLKKAIDDVLSKGKPYFMDNCRQRALNLFNKDDRYKDYIDLFNEVINKKNV